MRLTTSSFVEPARELVEVGCFAHARRHVYHAREMDPARMGAVLAYIGQLYAVEKRGRKAGLHDEELHQLRQEVSRPIAKQLRDYLLSIQPQLLPKSEAGQAVAYVLKNWLALTRYLEDGDLSIDNHRTERSLRGIAVGRRNWTFLGSDRGGKTMAILRSFVSSCELNKIDPFAWFRDVLARIPAHSIQKLDQLLPHNWAAQTN
jgi:transposase